MAVKANVTNGVQELAGRAIDKSVHVDAANRTAITAFTIFNTSALNVVLDIYDSPDATSAAGKPVANVTVGPQGAADDSIDINEVIGQAYAAGRNIVVVVDTLTIIAGDLTTKLTFTQYTGDS